MSEVPPVERPTDRPAEPSPARPRLDASQSGYAYRFDWGERGLAALADECDVIVVVDVLRFSTAVSATIEAGGVVWPAPVGDDTAELAGRHDAAVTSLSPVERLHAPAGARIVLASANGATLARQASERGAPFVLAGSLRNARATARRAAALTVAGGAIGVIAAGERWPGGDDLRPALEDLLGAGAILHGLDPSGAVNAPCCSPSARAARAAFLDARPQLLTVLAQSPSGRELRDAGCQEDVEAAAQLDTTGLAAQLVEGAFVGV